MEWLVVILVISAVVYLLRFQGKRKVSLNHLPEKFVVFDLETTGLDSRKHLIIEFGAIRVNRDSDRHDTFQSLVKVPGKVPKKITELTGITQAMLDADGEPIEAALLEFLKFVGELPLVSFNADFDMSFLRSAAAEFSIPINNPVSCALKMSRRAWPGRKSYRLVDLAKDGSLASDGTHRALGDCQRALVVYAAASVKLGTVN